MSQQNGQDTHGSPVTLGEIDTDGIKVGFIDQQGLAWESVEERDLALTAGRYQDAIIAWRSSGKPWAEIDDKGKVSLHCPSATQIAAETCLSKANRSKAARAARKAIQQNRQIRAAASARGQMK